MTNLMSMFWKRTGLIWLAAASIALPALAQTTTPQRPRSMTLRRPVSRGYLGVGVIELTNDRVKALNLKDDHGVEVKHVGENSPAARAGLKEGDVILEVNGKAIEDVDQFIRSIVETQPGAKVDLTVWRDGRNQTMSATVESRPANLFAFGAPDLPNSPLPPMPPMPQLPLNGDNLFSVPPGNSARVGFEGETLSPQLAEYFGVKEGVLVRSVAAKTPAERAGLKAGDVVVKVNGTPVTSPREISGLVRAGRRKTVSFTVMRNKKEMTLRVEIAEERVPSSEREVL